MSTLEKERIIGEVQSGCQWITWLWELWRRWVERWCYLSMRNRSSFRNDCTESCYCERVIHWSCFFVSISSHLWFRLTLLNLVRIRPRLKRSTINWETIWSRTFTRSVYYSGSRKLVNLKFCALQRSDARPFALILFGIFSSLCFLSSNSNRNTSERDTLGNSITQSLEKDRDRNLLLVGLLSWLSSWLRYTRSRMDVSYLLRYHCNL